MTDQYTVGTAQQDGIHAIVPRQNMTAPARKLRDTYNFVANAPLYHCEELGYFSLDRWREQGMPGGAHAARRVPLSRRSVRRSLQIGRMQT